MADLGSQTTDKRLSFEKYVTKNSRWQEIEFEIEKGKSTLLYKKQNNTLVPGNKSYPAGTKLKITNKNYIEIGKVKYAEVKIGSLSGLVPINVIRKPTGGNGTQYEDEVVDAINKYILEAGGTIDIKLEGDRKVYKNISYALKVDNKIKTSGGVKGDPKADIILCVDKKFPLAETSIFISHKKAGGAEAFQQYGGLSEQSGMEIYNNKIVQKFLSVVADAIGSSDKLPYPVMATFKDDKLANMSIFGPEYGKKFSLQHVQIIGQGLPKWKLYTNYVELSFSSNQSLSGDISHFNGDFLPVFGATFRAGRGFTYNNKRYNGARLGIYPKKLIATRSGIVVFSL